MSDGSIDDLDRRIVHSLQQDARNTSASEIAKQAGVSASTVRNRIHNLEQAGVLTGYRPEVNYEAASYQLHTLIVCTASIPDREALAQQALDVPGVVAVREIMTGTENVHVEAVGSDGDDLSRIGRDLDEIGLEVVDEDLIRNEYECAFHGFSVEDV
ncbi:Lrp/AsnC family transcriptional regulator [Natrinema halophilum]|uniref:Lrp/AsnC family transcriptional regulator n=1 Tax=Natrinema halophilum TaxID=1699371 RepID=A0A7D5KE34_9EURY|nr:Lrp/AsnC family transcriptional regulator [Natrinema halophilum]QLG49856.1 Lrp/AsnC family transcriptional regulator [Natrinema halophilum]